MNPVRIAVVGVGALGRHHARILAELETVELVGVVDTDPQTGSRVAESCGTRWLDDHRALESEVDAVSVAVPTTNHFAIVSDFLERCVPVFVEKPITATVDEAERLVELSRSRQTPLQVGYVERFNPATQVAWSLCGPPKYIRAERLSPFTFRSTDIGVVHDLMIHDLDLVLDLVRSPLCRVEAFGVSVLGGHEDVAQARLTFENGCIADLTASRVNPEARRSLQAWSHRGCVSVDFASREVVCYQPSEALLYGKSPLERSRQSNADRKQLQDEFFGTWLKVERPPVPQTDALSAELESFVGCVLQGRPPVVDGDEALKSMTAAQRVLDAIEMHSWDGHADGAIGPFIREPQQRRLAG